MSANQRIPFLWTLDLYVDSSVWRTLWRGPCDHSPLSLRGRKKRAPGHRGRRRNRETKRESTLHVPFLGAGNSSRAQFTSVNLAGDTGRSCGQKSLRCGSKGASPGWRGRPGAASPFPRGRVQADPWGLPPRHRHPDQDLPLGAGLRDSRGPQTQTSTPPPKRAHSLGC